MLLGSIFNKKRRNKVRVEDIFIEHLCMIFISFKNPYGDQRKGWDVLMDNWTIPDPGMILGILEWIVPW